jgi:hypothetical protein
MDIGALQLMGRVTGTERHAPKCSVTEVVGVLFLAEDGDLLRTADARRSAAHEVRRIYSPRVRRQIWCRPPRRRQRLSIGPLARYARCAGCFGLFTLTCASAGSYLQCCVRYPGTW